MTAIALALLFVVVPPAPALSQDEKLRQAINDLNTYRARVIDYRAGRDEAVDELIKMDRKRLTAALALIETLLDETGPWFDADFRAAAMMHTDAALRMFDADKESAFFHLNTVSDYLQRPRHNLAGFSSRWVFAVSRLMRSRGRNQDAERLLEMGRARLPADPIVFYESGLLQEMFATQWQTAAPQSQTGTTSELLRRNALDRILRNQLDSLDYVLKNRKECLEKAEAWLRKSVELAPSNTMGRLHLGRVLMMRRSNEEALRLLATVFDQTDDRATAYLAALFTGAVHEREGRLDAAAAAYRRAIDRFAQGHTAYVALSEVLQRAGNGDQSRAVLQQVLTEDPHSRREPWSWYFFEPAEIVTERFVALREEVRR